MLRFDLPPVWSNVTRWEAFITFLVSGLALLWTPWVMVLLMVQSFVRGFLGHYKCPAHRLWVHWFEKMNWGGHKENAGAKMFANKILFLASSVAVIAYAMDSNIWRIPCIILLIFSTMEWALSFCAACWAYGLWYRFSPLKVS